MTLKAYRSGIKMKLFFNGDFGPPEELLKIVVLEENVIEPSVHL
jgi:hypothetical protein